MSKITATMTSLVERHEAHSRTWDPDHPAISCSSNAADSAKSQHSLSDHSMEVNNLPPGTNLEEKDQLSDYDKPYHQMTATETFKADWRRDMSCLVECTQLWVNETLTPTRLGASGETTKALILKRQEKISKKLNSVLYLREPQCSITFIIEAWITCMEIVHYSYEGLDIHHENRSLKDTSLSKELEAAMCKWDESTILMAVKYDGVETDQDYVKLHEMHLQTVDQLVSQMTEPYRRLLEPLVEAHINAVQYISSLGLTGVCRPYM